jgi:hypothetical protein
MAWTLGDDFAQLMSSGPALNNSKTTGAPDAVKEAQDVL